MKTLPSDRIPRASRIAFGFALVAAVAMSGCSKTEAPQEPVRSVKVLTVSAGIFQSTSSRRTNLPARFARGSSPAWVFVWPARSSGDRPN
jgi:hypothetical protein